jgi:Phage tail assembly chaperone proteins, E, or 41 or 14
MDAEVSKRADGDIVVPLRKPILHGDEVITEIILREPSLGDLMALDDAKGDMSEVLWTIVACTGLPPSVVKQLKARDVAKVGEAAGGLMGEDAPPTGGKPVRGLRINSTGRRQT